MSVCSKLCDGGHVLERYCRPSMCRLGSIVGASVCPLLPQCGIDACLLFSTTLVDEVASVGLNMSHSTYDLVSISVQWF